MKAGEETHFQETSKMPNQRITGNRPHGKSGSRSPCRPVPVMRGVEPVEKAKNIDKIRAFQADLL
jgi:hypothetical protein